MNVSVKNISLAVGLVAVVIVGWFAWKHRSVDIHNLDSSGTTIVAFGDSLTYGVGSTPGHDFISLISARIDMPIINLGVSGNTTADAMARTDDIFKQDPKIVIVLLGGNDYLRRIPMDDTFANLDKIVDEIQSHGAAVLLLGVRGGLLKDSYNSRFEVFAREHGTGFVPNVLDGLLGNRDYMSDEIHPNDAGYAKIADKVAPELKRMLQ